VSLDTLPVAGGQVAVAGHAWGTDRCDARVEIIESRGKTDRVVARASPGDLGDFNATVDVRSLASKGRIRFTASQDSALEVADPRGRPARARCIDKPRTTRTFESRPAKVIPPVPPPEPPPPPPPPSVTASFASPTDLRVTGANWDPTACPDGVHAVAISGVHEGSTVYLGKAVPDSAGGISADLDPQVLAPGDRVDATQPRCDGSSSTASTTAG
jgi:hypothetical protein